MINLSNYIIEKFKISKDIEAYDDDKYYIFYFKDIKKLKNLKDLEEIKPVTILKRSDIKENEWGEINIMIQKTWIKDSGFDSSPNFDPSDEGEVPEEGDLVFNAQNTYFLYRPTIPYASCSKEGTDDEDFVFIGNKKSIIRSLSEYCHYQDQKTDIVEVNNFIEKNY